MTRPANLLLSALGILVTTGCASRPAGNGPHAAQKPAVIDTVGIPCNIEYKTLAPGKHRARFKPHSSNGGHKTDWLYRKYDPNNDPNNWKLGGQAGDPPVDFAEGDFEFRYETKHLNHDGPPPSAARIIDGLTVEFTVQHKPK